MGPFRVGPSKHPTLSHRPRRTVGASGSYQIFTRFSGASQPASPSFTPNAS